jgi:site-specific DNA recombinase
VHYPYPGGAAPARAIALWNGYCETIPKCMRGGCRLSQPPEPPAEPVPAIGYIRVSIKREEMISPETQRAAIQDAARRRGRAIIAWIEDLDKTGRNFNRRIMDAIARAEAGDVREIMVWKYSRFGRNRTGVAVNLARLEKAGGELISATEDIDARTATGRFTRGMLFEVAAFESDRIGETWREAYEYRASIGLPPLGRPRFGYVRLGRVRDEENPQRTRRETRRDTENPVDERYVPDAELGPVLAAMYRAYISGDGGPAIAARLNREQVPNACGRLWSGRTVLDVLDSGFGAGFLRLHNPSCQCGNGTRCRNRVWIQGKHDAVIPGREWEAYRQRREDAHTVTPRHRTPVYPVSGLARCGHCTGALVSGPKGPRGPAYRCSRHMHYGDCPGHPTVSLGAILDEVRKVLARLAGDIDAAVAVTEARTAVAAGARESAEKVRRELAANDRAMARLAVARAEDEDGTGLTREAWEQAAADLRRKREALEKRLAAASRTAAAASRDPAPAIRGILQDWDLLPVPDQNKLLRQAIRSITVWRTGDAARDSLGHFLPQPVRIEVIPMWIPGEGDPHTV